MYKYKKILLHRSFEPSGGFCGEASKVTIQDLATKSARASTCISRVLARSNE